MKTARQDGAFGRPADKRVVVCGPPGAGKATHVQQSRKPGDIVWDHDAIVAAMLGLEGHGRGKDLIPLVTAMRTTMLGWLETNPTEQDVWVIVTDIEVAEKMVATIQGRLLILDVEPDECMRRIRADASRTRSDEDSEAIVRSWWSRYTDWQKAQGAPEGVGA